MHRIVIYLTDRGLTAVSCQCQHFLPFAVRARWDGNEAFDVYDAHLRALVPITTGA
jgi:hypothetical protein